jgi:Mg2+ and Co2+ transporter CorA
MEQEMKVTISYAVDYEDLPKTVAQLLKNMHDIDLPLVNKGLLESRTHLLTRGFSDALASIDDVRRDLSKLDQTLIDYANIVSQYAKADADLKSGLSQESFYDLQHEGTQEVSAENILDETKTND